MKNWYRRRWHGLLCRRFDRHQMMLYGVGHHYFRQCLWCCKTGPLSEHDLEVINHRNAQLFTPIDADDDDGRLI